MCILLCVCACVHICVCIYVHVCVCMCACIWVYLCACVYCKRLNNVPNIQTLNKECQSDFLALILKNGELQWPLLTILTSNLIAFDAQYEPA